MEEKFNPVLLKIKAEKKIQEIFKNFEKFIEDQKACSSILN
jgi:cobyric acid synthase